MTYLLRECGDCKKWVVCNFLKKFESLPSSSSSSSSWPSSSSLSISIYLKSKVILPPYTFTLRLWWQVKEKYCLRGIHSRQQKFIIPGCTILTDWIRVFWLTGAESRPRFFLNRFWIGFVGSGSTPGPNFKMSDTVTVGFLLRVQKQPTSVILGPINKPINTQISVICLNKEPHTKWMKWWSSLRSVW